MASQGAYNLLVSNTVGTVISQTAYLTVDSPPSLLTGPENQIATMGDTATFLASARGFAH